MRGMPFLSPSGRRFYNRKTTLYNGEKYDQKMDKRRTPDKKTALFLLDSALYADQSAGWRLDVSYSCQIEGKARQ
jgi:hypothetical protein